MPAYGQYAEFSADSSKLHLWFQDRPDLLEEVLEMRWILNGQPLSFGSPAVRIPVDDKLDTLLYLNYAGATWDTILCHISEPRQYRFKYNTCCNAFDVYSLQPERRIKKPSVIFRTENQVPPKTWVGTVGLSRTWISGHQTDTISAVYWSPMQPNIYPISIQRLEECDSHQECTDLAYIPLDKEEAGMAFQEAEVLWRGLFMPLHEDTIKINFDLIAKEVSIRLE
ncbi:MAG TPA: hypothetical protein DCR93_05650 [Cytophagales bacterium]|nr:hypothetical protein [Cytophagales bacterium]